MRRQLVACLVGWLLSEVIVSVGIWLQLRYTRFGAFIWAANHGTSAELARDFGDWLELLQKAVWVNAWVICPLAALLAAALARLITRRTSWVLSIVVPLPLALLYLAADFGVIAIAASCFYILVAYGGMKAVDMASRARGPLERLTPTT